MNELVKQERHKLHMAADNIQQMLEVIEAKDEQHFHWAWKQLGANLDAIRACFIGEKNEHRKKIKSLLDDNAETLNLWADVDKRLIGSPEMDDVDVLKVVSGLKHFLKDLNERFDLDEFAE